MMLSLYRIAVFAGGPFIRLHLARRMARGKEDPARFGERLGIAGRPRPDGPLVWMHAASVGESLSVLPLIERIGQAKPGATVLLTTGTVTSARLMAERLPAGAIHQYVPVDRASYVRRFLDHWRPDLALWAESEFWPNLVGETARRGIPLVLVNGRISDRSYARWQRHRAMIGRLLAPFALAMGQSHEDAERLRQLGAPAVAEPGNLKLAAPPLPADPQKLADLSARIGARPCWVAASTHPGEEACCGRVHARVAREVPDLLTVIVPRHPERGAEVTLELASQGFTVARRGANHPLDGSTQVYVADTIGELGLFFRLAAVAFLGKSLVPLGGQNPLEAAHLDCAILFGPHMGNFREMAAALLDAGAAREVADEKALAAALARLLADAPERDRRAAAGKDYAQAQARVLDAVMAALAPFLARLPAEVNRAGA